MNDESNALMMRVMCSKDPTVRCAGQCDDPQCVTNANRNVTVSFSCPNCPTHLAQIESLTREKAEQVAFRKETERQFQEKVDECIRYLETINEQRDELRKSAFTIEDYGNEMIRLRAELDAAKVNEARYLWLREHHKFGSAPYLTIAVIGEHYLDPWSGDDPDKTIDTARSRATSGVDAAKLIGETGEKIG